MELFWFALDIPKYESKTSDLTMLQDGAYNRLMRHYYKTCSPIPLEQQKIVIITKAFSLEEIEAVSYILRRYFVEKSDGWHQSECDDQITKARRISKLRTEQGRLGGLAKARVSLQQNASKHPSETLDRNSNSNKEESKAKAASAFATPTWIPQEEWQAFEDMRKKMRKPMTDKARSLIVTSLHKLRSQGHSPKEVLEQSIRNAWQDVYEVKNGTSGQAVKQSRAREVASNNAAAFAAVMGGSAVDVGAIAQQANDYSGSRIVESEVKRLPERSS